MNKCGIKNVIIPLIFLYNNLSLAMDPPKHPLEEALDGVAAFSEDYSLRLSVFGPAIGKLYNSAMEFIEHTEWQKSGLQVPGNLNKATMAQVYKALEHYGVPFSKEICGLLLDMGLSAGTEDLSGFVKLYLKDWSKESLPPRLWSAIQPYLAGTLTAVPALYNESDALWSAKNIDKFTEMIFTDPAIGKNRTAASLDAQKKWKVISNNEAHTNKDLGAAIRGNALTTDVLNPIGYNVHLPENEIKAVLFRVYGGSEKTVKEERIFAPNQLYIEEQYLLHHGVAVITLNLADLNFLNGYQLEMPEELFERLHKGIHHAFTVFDDTPETLHPDLSGLKKLPKFLYGGSFGGLVTVIHAGKYPGSFKGYISQDGGLSWPVSIDTDLTLVPKRRNINMYPWLEAANFFSSIKDSVAIIQSFDDNNVNVAVALDAFKKMQQACPLNKGTRLFIAPQGANVFSPSKLHDKGHGFPLDQQALDFLLNFIVKGPSLVPSASEFRQKRYEMLAFRNMRFATPTERFISEAYRFYIATEGGLMSEAQWEKHYAPLFKAVKWAEILCRDEEKLNAEIGRLVEQNLLSDAVIEKTIRAFAPMFADFLRETNKVRAYSDQIEAIIVTSAEIRKHFVNDLLSFQKGYGSIPFRRYMVRMLFTANPELAANAFAENDSQLLGELSLAKTEFLARLLELKKTSQAMFAESLQLERR